MTDPRYVHVTCWKCKTENSGSSLICKKCQTKLVSVLRNMAPQANPKTVNQQSFLYEFFIDLKMPGSISPDWPLPVQITIPTSHCSSCFKPIQPQDLEYIQEVYSLARLTPSPGLNYFTDDLQMSFVSADVKNQVRTTTKARITLHLPLCVDCFFDKCVLNNYVPVLYDPSSREDRTLRGVGLFFRIAAILSGCSFFIPLFLLDKLEHTPWILPLFTGLFFSTFLWILLSEVFLDRAKVHDRKLKKALITDAKNHAGFVRGNTKEGYSSTHKLPPDTIDTAWVLFTIDFKNEQYRNLLAKSNRSGPSLYIPPD